MRSETSAADENAVERKRRRSRKGAGWRRARRAAMSAHDGGRGRQPGDEDARIQGRRPDLLAPRERGREQGEGQGDREGGRAGDIQSAGPPRRVPAVRCRPRQAEGGDADRNVDIEDVAPRCVERTTERPVQDSRPIERGRGVDPADDPGPDEGAGGHPEEGQGPDHPESARPAVGPEQVRRGRRPDRHEDAAADCLDEPGRDEELEGRCQPGKQRADREGDEAGEEEAANAPLVGEPARQRHRHDIGEEVPVDDPGGLAELGPAREVGDDRRQGHGRDHELEAGEEDADREDRQEDEGSPPMHPGECTRSPASDLVGARPATT